MAADRARKWATAGILLAAVSFNAISLTSEISFGRYDLNDGVLHYAVIERMSEALVAGEDPLDCWHPVAALGYPFHHTYPPLGHAAAVIVHRLLLGTADLLTVFCWLRYLLLCLYPLSVYLGARWMGFSRLASSLSGLLCSLVATGGYYGLEFGSYLWRGSGLYAQQWAMLLLPLAMGAICRAVREGRGRGAAALLLGLTYLSHVIYGYIASISALLLLFGPERGRRGVRLSIVFAIAVASIAFFVLPFLLDGEAINHSRWEEPWKWDSIGHERVLSLLFQGKLFDWGRQVDLGGEAFLPYRNISMLLALGAIVAALRREEAPRFCLAGLLLWIAIFCGRPTWGILADLLPLSADLPFHRLIGGVHFFGVLLAGWGLAFAIEWIIGPGAIGRFIGRGRYAVAGLLIILITLPLWWGTIDYLEQGREWGEANRSAHLAEAAEIEEVVERLGTRGAGRVYPGLAGGWGKDFRVGRTPFYGVLTRRSVDCLAFLYHAMSLPSDLMVHFDEKDRDHYSLFHVNRVVTNRDEPPAPFLEKDAEFGRFRVWRAPGGEIFEAVRADVIYRGGKRDLYEIGKRWLEGPLPGAGGFIEIVPEDSDSGAALAPEDPIPDEAFEVLERPGEVMSTQVGGGIYRAEVEFDDPGALLFKMSYHPRWRVTVDGEVVPPILLTPGFAGVRLAPGAHTVSFTYAPPWWRAPLLWLGGIVIAASIFLERIGRLQRIEEAIHARWERLGERCRPLLSRLPVESIRAERFAIAALAVLVLAASLPLFQPRIHDAHDARGYVPRLVEFHENVREGTLIPRWAPDLTVGRGQPLFVFSPPLFYIVSDLFHLLGAGPIVATHLACVAGIVSAAVGIYLLGRAIGGRWGGVLAAAAYLFGPYFLVDLYVRMAYAEFIAFACFPWALLGIWRLAHGGRAGSLAVTAFGIAGVMLSHNAAALIFVPFCALWVGALAAKRRDLLFVLRGGGAMALGLALAAYFWVPALLERGDVWVDRLLGPDFDFRTHFATLSQIIYSPWGYGLSVAGPDDGMSFAIGWAQVLIALGVVILSARRIRETPVPLLALIVGAVAGVFFATGISRFLWEAMPVLQYMAYPWRFLCLVTICLAAVVSFLPPLLPEGRTRGIVCGAALLAIVGLQIGHAGPQGYRPETDDRYTPEKIARSSIAVTTAREFEPRTVTEHPPHSPMKAELVEGRGEVEAIEWTPERRVIRSRSEEGGRLRLNLSHYPGWEVRLDGERVDHDVEEGAGRIVVDLPPGDHEVEASFRSTPLRLASGWLSALALLGLSGLLIAGRLRPR